MFGRRDNRRLLIVDKYRPHRSEESITLAKEECYSEVIIIPGGCTSIVQPMDKCVKPFKDRIRDSWSEWMRSPRAKTKQGNLKQPTRQDVINWASRAWQEIRPELLIHSFLVCGISNALDGTEDDLTSDKLPQVDMDAEEESGEESGDEDEDPESDSESDADNLDPFDTDTDTDSA